MFRKIRRYVVQMYRWWWDLRIIDDITLVEKHNLRNVKGILEVEIVLATRRYLVGRGIFTHQAYPRCYRLDIRYVPDDPLAQMPPFDKLWTIEGQVIDRESTSPREAMTNYVRDLTTRLYLYGS